MAYLVTAYLHQGSLVRVALDRETFDVCFINLITFKYNCGDYILQNIAGIPPNSNKKILTWVAKPIELTEEEQQKFSQYIECRGACDKALVAWVSDWIKTHLKQ